MATDEIQRLCVRCGEEKPDGKIGPTIGRQFGVCRACVLPGDKQGPVTEVTSDDILRAATRRARGDGEVGGGE